ncbi:MAG: helix-turn-helix domain-containing protein [Bacillota bacterium]
MKNVTTFQNALRNSRKEIYTNGEEMAEKIGCSEKTYRQYEKENSILPPPEIALRICQTLDNPSLFINYLHQLFTEQDYYPIDLQWFLPLTEKSPDLRKEVLTTIKEIRDVVNLEHTIIDISIDGKISSTENKVAIEYLKEVDDLINALIQLKTRIREEINNLE